MKRVAQVQTILLVLIVHQTYEFFLTNLCYMLEVSVIIYIYIYIYVITKISSKLNQ